MATATLDLDTMTTEELRAEFVKLRKIASYGVSREEWMDAVTFRLSENPSPADWVHAAQTAVTECDRCSGTGIYVWGAIVNGQPSHTGHCYRCEGKGYQGQDDYRRNWGYDRHAIVRALS